LVFFPPTFSTLSPHWEGWPNLIFPPRMIYAKSFKIGSVFLKTLKMRTYI
jgi:hypothetical protein